MKKKLAVAFICLLLQTSCYVRTHIDADRQQLPADFSAPVIVITLEDRVGLEERQLIELEQDALGACAAEGLRCASLRETVPGADPAIAVDLLKRENYRALLKVVIDFWGSRSETLPDPVPTSVDNSDTGPASGSSFRQPGAVDYGETVPGPTVGYKEVEMSGSLLDLQNDQRIWFTRVKARPAMVGRSFLYGRYNRSLTYEQLAQRCLHKLAGELARAWPKNSET
ncbi:MAG: hypothetical protein JSU72_13265 [Deltaproteobacteria bacterium]|nr:MAG: hypothetical protein JSU72_13265 [Deltaproteobacteria bacterium]